MGNRVPPGAKRRRVLVLCYSFPPANAVAAMRGVRIARAFRDRGWEVDVLKASATGQPAGLEVDTSGFRIHSYVPRRISLFLGRYADLGKAAHLFRAGLRRLFYPDHTWLLRKPIEREIDAFGGLDQFDCVVSSSFPFVLHDICRRRLERGERFAWIADNRDMWAGWPFKGPMLVPKRMLMKVERKVLSRCDLATFASQATAAEYARRYGIRTMVVLNGVEARPPERKHIRVTPPLTFVHTGSLFRGQRDLAPLMTAIRSMDAEVVLAGEDLERSTETIRRDFATPVSLRGYLSREESMALQKSANFLVLALSGSAYDATYTPAKLFEYAFAGKPIVALVPANSDVGRTIAQYDLGIASLDPGEIRGFIDAIASDGWQSSAKLEELTATAQFGQFADAADELVSVAG